MVWWQEVRIVSNTLPTGQWFSLHRRSCCRTLQVNYVPLFFLSELFFLFPRQEAFLSPCFPPCFPLNMELHLLPLI